MCRENVKERMHFDWWHYTVMSHCCFFLVRCLVVCSLFWLCVLYFDDITLSWTFCWNNFLWRLICLRLLIKRTKTFCLCDCNLSLKSGGSSTVFICIFSGMFLFCFICQVFYSVLCFLYELCQTPQRTDAAVLWLM